MARLPKITNEDVTAATAYVGLPLVAYLYLDWRAALATAVVVVITLGILNERGR